MIRNYVGFPRGVTGRQLASLAYDQCVLFGADPVFAQAVRLDVDGGLALDLANGARVTSDVAVISVGVDYRRLAATGVDELIGKGVFYGAAVSEAPAMRGQRVFIVGAGSSAGHAAVYLAKYAHEVTIVVRGPSLATTMSDYLITEIQACANIGVRLNTQVTAAGGGGRLEHLTLRDAATSGPETAAAGALFIMIGARPNTGWLADTVRCDELGFILTGADLVQDGKLPDGWTLARPTLPMETSVPGVFAVGDVRHGSTKRVGHGRRGPDPSRSSSPTSSSPRADGRNRASQQIKDRDPLFPAEASRQAHAWRPAVHALVRRPPSVRHKARSPRPARSAAARRCSTARSLLPPRRPDRDRNPAPAAAPADGCRFLPHHSLLLQHDNLAGNGAR